MYIHMYFYFLYSTHYVVHMFAVGYSEGELDEVQRKYCSLSQSLSTVSLSVGSVVVVPSVGSSDVSVLAYSGPWSTVPG